MRGGEASAPPPAYSLCVMAYVYCQPLVLFGGRPSLPPGDPAASPGETPLSPLRARCDRNVNHYNLERAGSVPSLA